jgi:hypothetical protein
MKRVAAVLSVLCVSSAALAQAPAGWKAIKDPKGACQMSVPADWKQGEILGQKISMATGNGGNDAVVNTMEDTDWATFKSIIYSVYEKEKARPKMQDDAKGLRFEIVSMPVKGMTSWYVAVPAGKHTCNAQINFKKGDKAAEDVAKKIADTIRG